MTEKKTPARKPAAKAEPKTDNTLGYLVTLTAAFISKGANAHQAVESAEYTLGVLSERT